ncbi:hypothetical protein [Persicirhabdus sediminis]|uniref:Uncharacterized protein n=1 Tax=Persicirhabdus sediminis TaxID=454144 RepID=A0A8J7MED1_9BACT|nr:hypothetical protein [Persicirhabdus sediminis]MBK1791736.1 hypothetical protein [Persicirhabdus sediminis]
MQISTQHNSKCASNKTVQRVRRLVKGSALVELAASICLLVSFAGVTMKTTYSNLSARNWVVTQTMVDAYMNVIATEAQAIAFEEIDDFGSHWPEASEMRETEVELGKLSYGKPFMAKLYQARMPVYSSADMNGDGGDYLKMDTWRLRMVIKYEIDGRSYASSRTVVRNK